MPIEIVVTSAILSVMLTAAMCYEMWDDRREDKILLDRAKRGLDDIIF